MNRNPVGVVRGCPIPQALLCGVCLSWLVAVAVDCRADTGEVTTPPPAQPAGGEQSPSPTAKLKTLSIEELMDVKVSTVSRVEERIDEAPGNVYVYPRSVIQERGYRSLGELLQVVPGFTVFHRDLQYVAGVRGLTANDNEKITLLINGQPLNQVDEPDYLNGPINLDNVERVEVIVGPSSLFQQANTLAATVNVITKKTQGVEIIGAMGSDLPYAATLMMGKQWTPDKQVSFSFTTEQKDGFNAWNKDFRPNLAGKDSTGELDQPNFFSVLQGQAGEWSGQLVAYRTTFPELLINEASSSNSAQYVDQFYSAFVQDVHPWTATLDSILRLSTTYYKSTRMNEDGHPDAGLETSNAQIAYTAEAGLRYTGFAGQLIQAGCQNTYNDNFASYYVVDHQSTTLVDQNNYAVGFYADDTFTVTHWLKLIGGIRVDYNTEMQNDCWYPGGRAAIVWEPVTNYVSKLTYNRAVRMPAPWASPLNQAWGSNIPSSPSWATNSTTATAPEILTTIEWQNIVYFGGLRLGATVYHQTLQDFISWYGPHTNVGNFRGYGAELNLQALLTQQFTVWANASYNNSTLTPFNQFNNPTGQSIENHHMVVNPDGRIMGAPLLTANVGVNYTIIRNLILSPTLRYFTDQAGYDYAKYLNNPAYPGGVDNGFITIRNRFYFDATLLWRNWVNTKGLEMDLRLSGYNLTNNRQPVAMQWGRDTYEPRGISGVLAVDVRF